MTLFKEEDEEQQREKKFIYYAHPQTRPRLISHHSYSYLYGASVLILFVPSCYPDYPQIALALAMLMFYVLS